MAGLPQRILPLLIALLVCVLLVSPGGACPFCGMQGQTLTGEVGQAKLVLYGQLTNAKEQNNGDGTTDLNVETAIKNEMQGKEGDPLAGGNKTVRLERYLPPQPESPASASPAASTPFHLIEIIPILPECSKSSGR